MQQHHKKHSDPFGNIVAKYALSHIFPLQLQYHNMCHIASSDAESVVPEVLRKSGLARCRVRFQSVVCMVSPSRDMSR